MADIQMLDRLLSIVSEHIDSGHCKEVDERYKRAFAWDDVDWPPLVVKTEFGGVTQLPEPWDCFKRYSYRETFDDPGAMLQNMILDRVVPGLLLGDDSPLAIRNNHGTIQVASALGAKWKLHEDNFPWAEPVDDIAGVIDAEIDESFISRSVDTLAFYREKLAQYPKCGEAIQISMPDIQGPMDNAEMLWGNEIYYSFNSESKEMDKLFSKVTETMLKLERLYRPLTFDRLDPVCCTQHTYQIPGRLLIRNDSSIMLSPQTYEEFVRPFDAYLLKEIGGGSIHFCGNGQHLVEKMLEIPDLRGIDMGQSHLMDANAIYAACRERRVALTHLRQSREDLIDGSSARNYPTGAVLVYTTDNINDAREVVRQYKENAK